MKLRVSQGMRTTVKFRELLSTLTIGQPAHHHNLTFFPLLWPETHEPSYTLLSTAIEAGEAVVEEVNESGSVPNLAVTNKCERPLLIPEGEILIGAKQNRVINVTVLVAAGVKFVLPVSCVEAGRWRYQSRHFESKFCAPPSLRNKKLRAVHRNRSAGGLCGKRPGRGLGRSAGVPGRRGGPIRDGLVDRCFRFRRGEAEGTLQTPGVARGGCGRSGRAS